MFSLAKIQKYCAYQDRSVAEVRTKLKGFPLLEEEMEAIIGQLIDEGFLNDGRFAANFVKNKLRSKGWGRAKIQFHLKQKGISNDKIHHVLKDIEETDWHEQLQRNVEKWKRSNELTQVTYPKLVRFLSGKGFKISEIVKNISFLGLFLMAFLLHSCTTRYDIPSLKQKYYYTTHINQQPYIIYIDTIINKEKPKKSLYSNFNTHYSNPKSHLSSLISTAYLIDNSEFTSPQKFQISYKKRKAKAVLDKKSAIISNSYKLYEPPAITEFPRRYLDTLFPTGMFQDVEYAQADGYWESSIYTEEDIGKALLAGVVATLAKKKLHLQMDIYVPQEAGKTKRPLLMLMHGGAFYTGDKSETAIANTCKYFASLGYTTASINYRLGFQPVKASIERAGYRAVQDAHAALRFLLANAEKYRINPDYIFVGGASAGGITALHLAFLQNKNRPKSSYKSLLHKDLGNIESIGIDHKITFQIRSIANLWGGIDNLDLLTNNVVSVISYHGTTDPIVPYNYDFPMQKIAKKLAPVLFNKMYGSQPLHDELKQLGYREKLVSKDNYVHNLWVTKSELNDTYYMIINDMKQFFYEDLVPNPVKIEHDAEQFQRYYLSHTKDVDAITWQCDGGFIIHQNKNVLFVIWRTDATDRKLITSGVYKNGAAFKTEMKK